jgi:hypothetical protein
MALSRHHQRHVELATLITRHQARRSARQTLRSVAIGVMTGSAVYALLLLRALGHHY